MCFRHAIARPAAVLAIVVGLGIAGCSSDPPTPTATPTPTETPLPFDVADLKLEGDGERFIEMLSLLPASPVRDAIAITDFARMREVYDVPLPEGDESVEDLLGLYPALDDPQIEEFIDRLGDLPPHERAVQAYVTALLRPPVGTPAVGPVPWISGFAAGVRSFDPRLADTQVCCPTREYLGFDQRDVDMSASLGFWPPPFNLTGVVLGRIGPGVVGEAIDGCEECPVQPERREHMGHAYYRWSEPFQHNPSLGHAPPIFDGFGRGGSLLVREGQAFHNESELFIDTLERRTPSMADADGPRLLAEAMGRLDAISFAMGALSWQVDDVIERLAEPRRFDGGAPAIRESLSAGAVLRPFQAMATGFGHDEDGDYAAVAFVHTLDFDAQENARRLPERIAKANLLVRYADTMEGEAWAERTERIELAVDGRVLLVRLRGEIARSWSFQWMDGNAPLFVHE